MHRRFCLPEFSTIAASDTSFGIAVTDAVEMARTNSRVAAILTSVTSVNVVGRAIKGFL